MTTTIGTTDPTKQNIEIAPAAEKIAEASLVSHLNALIEQARSAKAPIETNWKRWREYYEGEQWQDKPQRPSWRVSNVINVSYANVETACAVVMSMMPKLIATPADADAVETADAVTKGLNYHWKKRKLRKKVKLALKDALFYGSGLFKVTWNPNAGALEDETTWNEESKGKVKTGRKVPMGELSVNRVSPFRLDPDPLALSVEDAAYTVETREVDLDYIRKRWPNKARGIQPDVIGQPQLDKVWSSSPKISAVDRDPATVRGQKGGVSGSMRGQVRLYEVWIRNIGLLYDADAPVNWKSEYEKYKNGRVIIMAGDKILMDEPNVFDDGQFPYIKFDNVERPDMFWGKSEIEPIEPLQKELNKRSSQIMESANMTADPKMLIPKSAGLKKEAITTKPGEKIPYYGNAKPEYMVPPSLPTYVPQSLDRTMGHVERVSGNYDMLGGARQAGISAASAISSMMEQAEKRPRMKMDNLNDAIVELGELMLSRIRQYYDKPRMLAITKGDGSEGVDFVELYSPDIKGHYDINIDVGSSLPASPTLLFQWASTLFEFGVLPPKWLLEAIEWPNRDQIMKELDEQKQQEFEQQMQLAQAGSQPQGPPQPPPANPFSMREGAPQGGAPPAPPSNLSPELASVLSQYLEGVNNGEGSDPQIDQMLGMLGAGGAEGMPPGMPPMGGMQ